MDALLQSRATLFGRLLDVWNGGEPETVEELITTDYRGHMLHLPAGERAAQEYAARIRSYQAEFPGTRFHVEDQGTAGDRLWTRLTATQPDGSVAHGMNTSRFAGELIAEEWAVWSSWIR